MSPRPELHIVQPDSPAQLAAAKARDAHNEAMLAADDAVNWLAEAAARSTEVCNAVGPSVLGVGRHWRLLRLAQHIEQELAQMKALPRT